MSAGLSHIKEELTRFGVEFSDQDTESELKDKLLGLPVTDAQVRELALHGIYYKDAWCWNRRAANLFIEEAVSYNKLLRSLPVSPQQRAILFDHGVFDLKGMTSGQAADIIYSFSPEPVQLEYLETFKIKVPANVVLTYGFAKSLITRHRAGVFGNV